VTNVLYISAESQQKSYIVWRCDFSDLCVTHALLCYIYFLVPGFHARNIFLSDTLERVVL